MERKSTINATLKFSEFNLPPIKDALVIGKMAPIGPKTLFKSLNIISRNTFKLVYVKHPIIEAVVVKKSDLRKVPEDKYVSLILEEASKIMDKSDCLRIDISVEIIVTNLKL